MSNQFNTTNKLSKAQKESVFLLSIGTFLEYFDLMLYVHMAVLLNELFFPQDNPVTAEIFAIFTFCSSFILRPIGGFIVGWIGDQLGRKNTIIITTLTMALCCLTMANIKTYAEIGITASIVIIICRVLQGFTSMGEIIGAKLYLAETLKQPNQYVYNMFIGMANGLGSVFALVVASFSLSFAFNWRVAFWVGTFIALVGLVARTRLRETPEFVDYKRRLKIKKETIASINNEINYQTGERGFINEKVDKKALLAFSAIRLFGPVVFYVAYIYCGDFMKKSLSMTAEQVINQNLKLNIAVIFALVVVMFLVKKYHPVKLAKMNILLSSLALLFIPYWFDHVSGVFALILLQLALHSFAFTDTAAEIACFKHIALSRRFTLLAVAFGITSAIGYATVPIALRCLTPYWGHYALWIIYIPVAIAYWCALNYIKKLEIKRGLYHRYPEGDGEDAGYRANVADDDSLGTDYQAFTANCVEGKALLRQIERVNEKQSERLKKRSHNAAPALASVNSVLVEKALCFAKKWHNGQVRKTGEPYYTHPLAVARVAMDFCFNTEVIVAAILHDVLEDSPCTAELIAKEFNPRIAQLVDRLTRVNYANSNVKLSIEDIMNNLKQMDDKEAMLIKAIDRLHNLETIAGMEQDKQIKTARETLKSILASIAYAVDGLPIENKLRLEERIYLQCKNILKANKNNTNLNNNFI